jgi:Ca-activated chloride channel family protein
MGFPWAMLILSAVAAAQKGVPAGGRDATTFHSGVSLVHVDAEVTDQEGRILGDLTRNDFRVFDDGKEQPLLHCSIGDDPLDLVLLFDVSGSMRPIVQKVAEGARQALRELRDGDRVSVMVFNWRAHVIEPFTENLPSVERSIRNEVLAMPFYGGTHIQAALDEAAMVFLRQKRNERRRAVLIVTDNMGQRTMKESTVVRDLWEADAIVTGLIVRNLGGKALRTIIAVTNPQLFAMQAGMNGIAAKTGGDTVHSDDPGGAFQEAMHRIRTRYSLYYEQPKAKPGTRRALRVELSDAASQRFPKARVKARLGYIVPEDPAN